MGADETAAALRRLYEVPDSVRLRVEEGRVLAFVDGADAAAAEVASRPDDVAREASLSGRGPLGRLASPLGPLLVRESRKGGLLRRLRGRRFVGPYRPLRELVLGRRCLGAGVPVAEAVACVVLGQRSWRGFLLTREVPGATDLEAWLYGRGSDSARGERDVLREAGRAVRALHDAGVRHADLHPKNLLLDPKGGVLVLDLDRARAFDAPLSEEDRLRNLVRLARAVEKHRLRGLRVSRKTALRFLEGYGGSREASARWLERVRERLSRGLFLRVAWWRLTGQARPRAGAGAVA
jgi:tRNA A-37 threonylcarbamoyl transferase component Bud32